MNEHEWKRGRDPEAMLAAVQDRLSQRKWVLLNCAVARRMLQVQSIEDALERISNYELDWTASPSDLGDRDFLPMGRPKWISREQRPFDTTLSEHPQGFVGGFYWQHSDRFAQRAYFSFEDQDAILRRFLTRFPAEAVGTTMWEHCRYALSAFLHEHAKEQLYKGAQKRLLDLIPKKAHTLETPAIRAKVEAEVRTIQKQLVLEMNKAMRNYAKPANQLLAHFLHEQLGNPFQPYEFDPAWRTADVMGLARGIEADRGFDRMNMLADALMEAGCEQEPMLLHLQEEREHQRGCWVLDLILGHDVELFARPPLEDVTGTGGRHEPLGLGLPRNWDV